MLELRLDQRLQLIAPTLPAALDFVTGCDTARRYSRAKFIDMIFWIEGAPQR